MSRPPSFIAAASAVVLPPGDAQASSTRGPGMGAGEKGDELRRFVLHDEPACVETGARQRLSLFDEESVGCEPRGPDDDRLRGETAAEILAGDTERVRAKRQRGRRVVEREPGLGGVEAEAVVPPGGEPAGMRQRDAEIVERGRRDRRIVRAGAGAAATPRFREIVRSTALTKPVALRFARPPRQIHRIVDHRRRGHARMVEQLIRAEAQDLDDLRVETIDRSASRTRR